MVVGTAIQRGENSLCRDPSPTGCDRRVWPGSSVLLMSAELAKVPCEAPAPHPTTRNNRTARPGTPISSPARYSTRGAAPWSSRDVSTTTS